MDIDPPEEAADGLSREQLELLGLPSHHIHYKAGGERAGPGHPVGTELLAPGDIQVSYTVKGVGAGTSVVGREVVQPLVGQVEEEEGEVEGEAVDPPRALPSSVGGGLRDAIFSVEAWCGLQCGRGVCHQVTAADIER